MEITLFGIKIRLELAIACMILGAIICYMLFCSCSLKEGWGRGGRRRGPGRSRGNVGPIPNAQQIKNSVESSFPKWMRDGGSPLNNHNNGHGGAL